ncbi:hypothetical protein TNCV_4353351 [Trichonephila clavipes]|nr:hypothetical protein TNCV_4353351 [Trichonephila clavipes]
MIPFGHGPLWYRGSLVVKVTNSQPVSHEFEPSTAEDPQCRQVDVKYVEDQTSFHWCGVEDQKTAEAVELSGDQLGAVRSFDAAQNCHFYIQQFLGWTSRRTFLDWVRISEKTWMFVNGGTLNSSRAASPLVRLVEGEERWKAPDHPQGVLPQNWGKIELNHCHMYGAQSYG